jgi:hypothetical protein
MNEEGFLVSASPGAAVGIGSWRFEDVEREGEGARLVGPDFAGLSLDEAGEVQDGMPLLLIAARAFKALSDAGRLPRGVVSSGVLVAEADAATLVLPPRAVSRALSAQGPETRAAAIARLASARAKGAEADASFTLAQAAYRYATGASAFERDAADSGNVAGARHSTAAILAAPRLQVALAALIDRALEDPETVGLAAWVEALEAAAVSGWTRDLSAGEAVELERRRSGAEAESLARRRRSEFLRKRGAPLIAAAVALAIAALMVGDYLNSQRNKPNFADLAPVDLVRRYYASIDSLDLDALEACGDKKAFKEDWNLVMDLTVISKTRLAYEGKSPVVHADAWLAAGMPKLRNTDLLFGIAGLAATDEGAAGPPAASGESERRIRASYSIWSMEHAAGASGDPDKAVATPAERRRVDELALARGAKGGWRIVGLERRELP